MIIKDSIGKAFRITIKPNGVITLNMPINSSIEDKELWVSYANMIKILLKKYSFDKTLRGETKNLNFYYLRLNSKIRTKRTCEFTIDLKNNTIIKGKYKKENNEKTD